jgi:hypothetical protein
VRQTGSSSGTRATIAAQVASDTLAKTPVPEAPPFRALLHTRAE